jgi:hypothetical protein
MRPVLLCLYTAVVAGVAFGIGYLVFEWSENGASESEITSRSFGERIEQLTDRTLESFEQCPDQLSRLTKLVGQAVIGQMSGSDFERELRVLGGQFLACVALARAMEGPRGLEAP